MPFLEHGSPEYLRTHTDMCVVRTLESLVSQICGRAYVVPHQIYEMRNSQEPWALCRNEKKLAIDSFKRKNREQYLSLIQLEKAAENFGRRISFRVDQGLIAGLLVPALEAVDPELWDVLNYHEFRFLRLSYPEMKTIAESGESVGVTVINPDLDYWQPHIFHIGKVAGLTGLYDLSDGWEEKRHIDRLIRDEEKITAIVEETMKRLSGWNSVALLPR